MSLRPYLATILLLIWGPAVSWSAAQNAPPACAEDERFEAIDFWVGEWDVLVDDQVVGHNLIEKILNGCAVIENWTAAGGSEGKSLFYFDPRREQWKQVWVTQSALGFGGVKEKAHIASYDDGGVRFQGQLRARNGRLILDRTTLTPLDNGSVRQVIEISPDGGENWRTTFDAIYRPVDDSMQK